MAVLRRLAWLCAASLRSTRCDGEEEFSALLQTSGRGGLSSLVLRRSNQGLEALLVSATDMLRNGAAPEILAFTDHTLDTIKAEVLPVLEGARAELEQMLVQQRGSGRRFAEGYQRRLDVLATHRQEEGNASAHHRACRLAEQSRCAEQQECEQALRERWEAVEELEEELELIAEEISGRWCPAGVNLSEDGFRGASVGHFDKYSKKREHVREAWKSYSEHLLNCQEPLAPEPPALEPPHAEAAWGEESTCDALQRELEAISCMRSHYAGKAKAALRDSWGLLEQAFNDTVATVAAAVEARKHEWTTLKTVECLLLKIHDFGGKPCEELEGGSAVGPQVESCRHVASNTSHLDIQIPALAVAPQPPERLAQPCEDGWVEQEYAPFDACVVFAPCRKCATSWDEW